MEGTTTDRELRFNPYEPGFAANRYRQYRRLRERDPVHQSFMGTWVLTRYEDVHTVLRSPDFSSELHHWEGFHRRYRRGPMVEWLLNRTVLNVDPPLHTALKRALVRAFGPKQRETLAEAIEEIVDDQIRALEAVGPEIDVIEQYALPVPIRSISHVYNLAAGELAAVKQWSNGVSGLIEPLPSLAALEDAERSIAAFKAYLAERLDESRCPVNLPARVADEVDAGSIDVEHALANLILLFPAGHETTVNLIGNGLHALLRHPDQLRLLRETPDLVERAVEEMLRYEPPQQVAWRTAVADHETGGRVIREGDHVMAVLGAANRDPDVFDDPDRFDVTRHPNPHLAFGYGRHGCLGSWFARLQGEIALRAFITAFPGVRPAAAPPAWRETMSFHGLKSLPVEIF